MNAFILGIKIGFRQENYFFVIGRTPHFVNGLFVALGETAYFAPSDRFSTFRFGVTAVFVKKKSAETPTTYYSKYIFTNDHNSPKALPSLD